MYNKFITLDLNSRNDNILNLKYINIKYNNIFNLDIQKKVIEMIIYLYKYIFI